MNLRVLARACGRNDDASLSIEEAFEEDTPALPVLNSFSLEEDTPAVLKDEYKILREIGRGAFGVVHEAIHIKVCPKVLKFVSSKYLCRHEHIQSTKTCLTDIRTSCRENHRERYF